MKQHKDRAIILGRINYGEHDRILMALCADHGKISLLAKGARLQKSKLAGGVELLSESSVSFIEGRSNLRILTGSRLNQHFGNIGQDAGKLQQAFDFLKIINKLADERAGQEYYPILLAAFAALDDEDYDPRIVQIWFDLHIMKRSGGLPSLSVKANNSALAFDFDYSKQAFVPSREKEGGFSQNDLKLLRLCAAKSKPPILQKELGSENKLLSLARSLLRMNVTEV